MASKYELFRHPFFQSLFTNKILNLFEDMGGSNSTSKEEGMSATQELYHLSDEARLESVERDLETLERCKSA